VLKKVACCCFKMVACACVKDGGMLLFQDRLFCYKIVACCCGCFKMVACWFSFKMAPYLSSKMVAIRVI